MLAACQALRTTWVDPVYGKRMRNFVKWSWLSLISPRGTCDDGPSTRTWIKKKARIYNNSLDNPSPWSRPWNIFRIKFASISSDGNSYQILVSSFRQYPTETLRDEENFWSYFRISLLSCFKTQKRDICSYSILINDVNNGDQLALVRPIAHVGHTAGLHKPLKWLQSKYNGALLGRIHNLH